MKDYQNLVDALQDLKKRGYVANFNLKPHCIECPSLNLVLHPEEFKVVETYRFEGMSNPDDNTVLYVLESNSGVKGVLVDAYGPYAEALTLEMAAKLSDSR